MNRTSHKKTVSDFVMNLGIKRFFYALTACFVFHATGCLAAQDFPCLSHINPSDGIFLTDSSGNILVQQNASKKFIPASTLKLITALAAIHHMGLSYRFFTEFYTDANHNLLIKGYGDPLLTSEVWQEIALVLSRKIRKINRLILDDSYFAQDIRIPGKGVSTNPYDAPSSALCANFNTIFFDRDTKGNIISAEPQTPMIPFARNMISRLKFKKGRYTFTHNPKDATQYAGELFLHFMKKNGVTTKNNITFGTPGPGFTLIHTHPSPFSLNQVIQKIMAFSNNFIANQVCIGLGAKVYGTPGNLEKGVRTINDYVKDVLGLKAVTIVEGSGISRENRISPLEMKKVLDRFTPYRYLLKKEADIFFKTGTLEGIRTRAGYLVSSTGKQYSFVIFLNHENSNMDLLMKCISKTF